MRISAGARGSLQPRNPLNLACHLRTADYPATSDPLMPASSTQPLADFDQWFAGLARLDGIAHISTPRTYAHDEAAYDAQYGVDQSTLSEGLGAVEIFRKHGADFAHPLLEVGCGTGILSAGLLAAGAFSRVLLTDSSPAFLNTTESKITGSGLATQSVRYAVLNGDDLARLPAELFSVIVMRSTLHHIADVGRILRDIAGTLRHGGLFVCQEPIADGFILMTAVAKFIPLVAAEAGSPLTDLQNQQLAWFLKSMEFLIRRDVDKSHAEDRHLFRPHDLGAMADEVGMSMHFLPSADVRTWAPGAQRPSSGRFSFADTMRDYLKHCMNFGDSFTRLFDGPLKPYLAQLEELSLGGDGSPISGIFVFRKR